MRLAWIIGAFIALTAIFYLSINLLIIIFIALVLLLGVPHGAFDLMIWSELRSTNTMTKTVFFHVYFALCGTILLLFYALPMLMFCVFLAYSAYHFGMDYCPSIVDSKFFAWNKVRGLMTGIAIISVPAVLHANQVEYLLQQILITQEAGYVTSMLNISGAVMLVPILLIWVLSNTKIKYEALTVVTAALITPPLTFLTVYFVLVHSIKHLEKIFCFLRCHSLKTFVKQALPFTAISYLLCIGIYLYITAAHPPLERIFASLIFLLAALTLPHLLIVERMQKRLSSL